MTRPQPTYMLVTPARNEARYIERVLDSVTAQTILPARWIIVDDGSTDATADIAHRCAQRFDFIRVHRRPPGRPREFASKVQGIREAYGQLRGLAFDYFGNLDADIVLPPGYYEQMMERCERNPRLGIVGGRIVDRGREAARGFSSPDSVGCAVQFFRRRCYEETGGYLPLPLGGEDAAAEIMARMRGWEVRCFSDIRVVHLRATGQGMGSTRRARFFTGIENYSLGYHPLFFALKCWRRLREPPRIFGSLCMAAGYLWARATGYPILLPPEVVAYLRGEQSEKLRRRLFGAASSGSAPSCR